MVTIKSPADIPAVVSAVLGFEPSDSLVILGLGGPSGRVDISEPTCVEAVEAFRVAAAHWGNGVIVALYSEDLDLIDVESAMMSILPDVEVKAAVDVTKRYGKTHVVDAAGNLYVATESTDPEIASKRVVSDRATIEAEAAAVASPDIAWTMAIESYRAGNGARAWCYLDRFHALVGEQTSDSEMLAHFLTNAVNPKSETARALLG